MQRFLNTLNSVCTFSRRSVLIVNMSASTLSRQNSRSGRNLGTNKRCATIRMADERVHVDLNTDIGKRVIRLHCPFVFYVRQ